MIQPYGGLSYLRVTDHIVFSKELDLGFEFELILRGLNIPPSVTIHNMSYCITITKCDNTGSNVHKR